MRLALVILTVLTLGWRGIAPAASPPTVPTTVGITGGGSAAGQTLPALQNKNYSYGC